MRNFRLIKKEINVNFILDEIDLAIKNKYIEEDFGVSKRLERVKSKLDYFSGKYHDSHTVSGWNNIICSCILENPYYWQLCSENSKFLYKTNLYNQFPKTLEFLRKFAKENNSILQRVSIVSLSANGEVLPHVDTGEYPKWRDRYQFVLISEKGSEFSSGNEKQILKENELWYFNNKELHSVRNLSNSPRLHIIFDLLPKNHFSFKQKIINAMFSYFYQKYYDLFGKEEFDVLLEKYPLLLKILFSK